jgi:hypothetical protein
MSTLISVYKGTECVGRCDAKCYEAQSPICECDCICGGRNHGAGQQRAEENTRKHCEAWIETYINNKGIVGGKGEVNPDLFQLKLF